MSKLLIIIGNILRILAFIVMFGGGLYSLFICWSIVKEVLGPVVAFLGLLIFPIVLIVSPIYAMIAWGRWFPLVLVYGLGFLVGMMLWAASLLTGEE